MNSFLKKHTEGIALIIYQSSDLFLLTSGLFASWAAIYQIRMLKMRKIEEEESFDDDLLLVGLLGVLFYNMFLLFPAAKASGKYFGIGMIFVSKAIVELAQSLSQVCRLVSLEFSIILLIKN